MPNKDFTHTLSRQDYEEIVQPVLENFKRFLTKARDQFQGSGIQQIHSIELVSDTSRLESIQKIIKEVFNVSTDLKRTMNAQECIARGATILAAQIGKNLKAQDYVVDDSDTAGKCDREEQSTILPLTNQQILDCI